MILLKNVYKNSAKELSQFSGVFYNAINNKHGRVYSVDLILRGNLIKAECIIKDFYSSNNDRNQWALLLSEIRKDLRNDL